MSSEYRGCDYAEILYPTREIIFRAWSDDAFKQRLLTNPLEVMREFGAKIPSKVTELRVVENSDAVAYFILPKAPDTSEMSDDEIKETIDSMLLTQLVFPTVLGSM